MKRSDIKEYPDYFEYYIKLVDDVELSEAFDRSLAQIDAL
ncbi:MAG: DinB family protein, partial [Chitinophagaceae bacterium]